MDIHSSAGVLRAGRYSGLMLTGDHTFEPGVEFTTCSISGSALMHGCTGTTLACRSAHVRCRGDMDLEELRGYGEIEVSGSLRCRSIDFTGTISVIEALTCEETLDLTGALTGPRLVSVTSMRVVGALHAGDVMSTHICVSRLGDDMYVNKLTPQYRARSILDGITGQWVSLENVSCQRVDADHATLRQCDVRFLAYSHTVALDSETRISRMALTSDASTRGYRRSA